VLGTANVNNVVFGFSIKPSTGALAPLPSSPFVAGLGIRVTCDPAGKFLLAVNSHEDTASVFAMDAGTGDLTQVPGSPFATNFVPTAVVVDPQGKFVYVANAGSGDLSVFSMDTTTGSLSSVAGSPFVTGQQTPTGLAIVGQ
jgi:6-phosphogluconolactonase (cycloisomerase 2 family)